MTKGNWASQVAGVERTCAVCGKGEEKEHIFQYANQREDKSWDTYKAHLSCAGSDNPMTPRPEPKRKSNVRVKQKGPLSE